MVRFLFSLLIAGGCCYYGILYENTIIITASVALLMLAVFCVLEVVYRRFTTSCQLNVPVTMVDSEKPVPLVFQVTSRSLLAAGALQIKIGVRSSLAKKSDTKWLMIPQINAGSNRYEFELQISGTGRYEIEIRNLRFQSTFGLCSMRKRVTGNASVLILPQMYSFIMEITEPVKNFMGDADVYDEFRPGYDGGETFEIREYREKDKLQSIHWKLSAKAGDIMVRANSLPKACAVVLMLEHRVLGRKDAEKYASTFLEVAASLSFGLMDKKIPHFVAWISEDTQDIRRIRVDDEESFYLFMTYYLNDHVSINNRDVRDEYREKYRNEIHLKDICINSYLEVYQDGELLHKLDVKKIKDECEKLELLL